MPRPTLDSWDRILPAALGRVDVAAELVVDSPPSTEAGPGWKMMLLPGDVGTVVVEAEDDRRDGTGRLDKERAGSDKGKK